MKLLTRLALLAALLGFHRAEAAPLPVAAAPDKAPAKLRDALELAPAGSVKLQGWIAEEMALCKRGRILGQNVPDLVKPFAVREEDKLWRCEFWGKWFTSAALAYRYDSDPNVRAVLDEALQSLLATQSADGSITTYKAAAEFSNWDTWGRKYTLLGLLSYHELSGEPKVLQAACRHADSILEHFGPGKTNLVTTGWWNGMAASSILEPMVLLYRRTGEARYLQFAQSIVESWQLPGGPDLVRKALDGVAVFKMFPGPDKSLKGYSSGGFSKAYEMMSCYEGLLELYRVTANPTYLQAATKVFANIRDTEITLLGSGSSWERWCDGRRRQAEPLPEWMETCVTVTYIKFAGQLLRLTGDSTYADEIERSTYNALLAAQKRDGSWWSHYNPLEGPRGPAPEHCGMHMNCCVANGPRALMLLPALALMSGNAGPVVNLFEPASATLPLPSGHSVALSLKSHYPLPGPIDIGLRPQAPEVFTLSVRIPAWSRSAKVLLNGKSIGPVEPGSYARLTRLWQASDTLRLSLDFGVEVATVPGESGRIALTRGPVVFALDKRLSRELPGASPGLLKHQANRVPEARPVKGALPAPVRMALEVPFEANGKPLMLRLCDYASAGQSWGPESSLRVWLPQPLNLQNPFEAIPLNRH